MYGCGKEGKKNLFNLYSFSIYVSRENQHSKLQQVSFYLYTQNDYNW